MTPRLVRSLLAIAAALAPAAVAAQPADNRAAVPAPVARMQAPTGWNGDSRTAVRVQGALVVPGAVFPGVTADGDAQAWTSTPPGAAIIATQATSTALPADPAAAATVALHDLRAGADAVDGAKVTTWELKLDPAGKVHEARLEWSEPSIGTTTIARALVYRAGGALVRIGGECILGPDGAAARPTCETVLASLAPTATAFEPIAVSATPPPATPSDAPPPGDPSGARPPGAGTDAPGIRPREGDIPSTLAVRPAPKRTDRRPFYVGAGIVLLALVFWWNRREREKREEADRAEEERQARKRRKDDDDADEGDAGSSADAIDAEAPADDEPSETKPNETKPTEKKPSEQKPSTDEEPS